MTDPADIPPSGPARRAYWYHEPLAWLVFGLPAVTVVACMVTIVIAVRTSDALVVDDYYKAGLEINKVIAREDRAAALGLDMSITLADDGGFDLALQAAPEFVYPELLEVRFTHATRADADRVVSASHDGAGHYLGTVGTPLARGPWYVNLSTAEWRVVRRSFVR